jgi:hypothetical protein
MPAATVLLWHGGGGAARVDFAPPILIFMRVG